MLDLTLNSLFLETPSFNSQFDFPGKLKTKSIAVKLGTFYWFIYHGLLNTFIQDFIDIYDFAFLFWSLCLDIWLIGEGKYWPDSTLAQQPNWHSPHIQDIHLFSPSLKPFVLAEIKHGKVL